MMFSEQILTPIISIAGVLLGGFLTYRVTGHFERKREAQRQREELISQYLLLVIAYNSIMQFTKSVATQIEIAKQSGPDQPVWALIPEIIAFGEEKMEILPRQHSLSSMVTLRQSLKLRSA